MDELLPIFPLGTVLFPGMPLALHIFEERYREMVHDLVAGSSRRWFGVVAIKRGSEVGDTRPEMYDVGCIAVVRRVDAYPDGRYDIMTAGGPRFSLGEITTTGPYLQASVTLLREDDSPGDEVDARSARAALTAYWDVLSRVRGESAPLPLPDDDGLELAYLAASVLQVDVEEKQSLLECVTSSQRLTAVAKLLRRETGLLKHFAAVRPGDDLISGPISLN